MSKLPTSTPWIRQYTIYEMRSHEYGFLACLSTSGRHSLKDKAVANLRMSNIANAHGENSTFACWR